MHSLLQRQIRRYVGETNAPPPAEGWERFIDAVNNAYEQFDRDRILLERSLELTAQDVLEANSKLRAAFDAFPDILLRLDSDGKVMDYTAGRTTRLQLQEQVLSKPLRDAIRWEDTAALEDAVARVQQTKEIVSVETTLVGSTGSEWYEARVAPLLDDQIIVVIRNVSERRRMEEELRSRERQQAAVAALGQRGLAAHDLSQLLDEAVKLVAETLQVEHSTVWELQREGRSLLVRAGLGWSQSRGAPETMDVGDWLPAVSKAFLAGEPLVIEDFGTDLRFGARRVAHGYGLKSGMMVRIPGLHQPFGALSAYTDQVREFARDDAHFLQAAANVLAAAVNRIAAERDLQEAKDAAEERTRELKALLEISSVVGSTLELRPLLGFVLDGFKRAIDYSAATITVFDRDTPVILDYRGPLPRERLVGLRLPIESEPAGLVREIATRRRPLITDDLGGVSVLSRYLAQEGLLPVDREYENDVRSQMTVPLVAHGRVIGSLGIVHQTPGFYTERHARLAMAFAQQAATAIENARLYEEARGKAALEERQRLARELHDSVSQALYGIALNASAAEELFDVAPDRTRSLLGDVLHLADAAMAEMRSLIFELRPESLAQEGLVGAIEKQAAALEARHGLQVRVAMTTEPELPLPMKEALYRVAQEAMHNAAKHARARTLQVVLEVRGEELGLLVVDDGRGFNPKGDFPGHLGLQSMRERAAAVGGTLEIDSAPSLGTRLHARVPLRQPLHC